VDAELAAFLDRLYRSGREHDATKEDRLERLRNVEPDTAELLGVLVRATAARRVLEIGTSNGYSTVWLADAVRATGGSVLSVDVEVPRTEQAQANLREAGLGELVELRTEDAAETLRGSAGDAWDLVFLDAERPAYAGYWPELLRVLRPGGLLVVDNVISHADQVAEFRALVDGEPRATSAVVPSGAGALLAVLG
jgi:predicted O-methyltransferase YrrM